MGLLGIEDAQFWSEPLKDQARVTDRLFDEDLRGLLLDAPRRVGVEERQTLPLVAGHHASFRELKQRELGRAGVLVAVEDGGAQLTAERLVPRDHLPTHLPPPPPADAKFADGTAVMLTLHEARELLHLPWRRGRWRLQLLLADQTSERLEVELVEPPRFQDPAAAKFLEQHRRTPFPRPVSPRPGGDVSYRPAKDGPAAPGAPGIALGLARVGVAGEPVLLRGALRRRPRPGEVVRRRPAEEPADLGEGYRWQDVGDPEATAVLSVHLVLLVGGVDVAPSVVGLQVPSYDPPGDPAAPAEVTACFAVDLAALGLDAQGEVFVRAFSGDLVSEAARAVLLRPDALRGE